MNAKILVRMPRGDWFIKVMALKEKGPIKGSKKDIFASLRAHEFDLTWKNEPEGKKATQQSKLEDAALFVKKLPRKHPIQPKTYQAPAAPISLTENQPT